MTLKIIATILRNRFFLLLPVICCSFSAAAQVKFSAVSSSKEVGRNDYIQVEFVVENATSIEKLNLPAFPDFRIIQGPIQTSGMSVVNGAMSQYKGVSFVLQPIKSGRFTIPGATAMVDGKAMQSNTVRITVSSTASTGPSLGTPFPVRAGPSRDMEVEKEYILKRGDDIDQKIRDNLFVKVEVSKTSCYSGEPIMATYKLYSKLMSESRVTRQPSLNGFSVYDMNDPGNDVSYIEKVGGRPFTVHVIRKAQLIPLQAGTIELDPVEVENAVHFLKTNKAPSHRGSMQNVFDPFFDEEMEGIPVDKNVTLTSKPITITVKPLPEDKKPENYNGAVGRFTIDAKMEKNEARADDASTLLITVKGAGNLPIINAPAVSWPADFENYDTKEKEDVDKTIFPLSGSKTFRYQFIPKAKGSYTIPVVPFSYFDPSSSTYKTIQTRPLDVQVGVAAAHKVVNPATITAASEPGIASSIKTFFEAHLEVFFALLIFAALACYLFLRTKKSEQVAETKEIPQPAADQVVAPPPPPDPLRRSRRLLEMENYKGFYTELNRAIWEAAGDKLQLPGSAMNKHDAVAALKKHGVDDTTTLLFEDILHECEVNLYTPVFDVQDLHDILNRSEYFLDKLAKVS